MTRRASGAAGSCRYGRRMLRAPLAIAVALAVALLCVPSDAPAFDGYEAQRPASQRVVELVQLAQDFWAARGVRGCSSGITAWTAPDLSGSDEREPFGRGADCAAWMSQDIAADLESSHPYQSGLQIGCMAVFHEVGHALGLPHVESGLMSPVGSIPWDCKVWVRGRLTVAAEAARLRSAERRQEYARATQLKRLNHALRAESARSMRREIRLAKRAPRRS